MVYARVWYEPASVKVTIFSPGADVDAISATLKAEGHVNRNATFEDFESPEALAAVVPSDRTDRARWRKNPTGRGVVVV